MTANKNKPDLQQTDSKKDAIAQYGFSVAIGVLLITITVATFYFGLFPNYK